jgi:hypothetical protein
MRCSSRMRWEQRRERGMMTCGARGPQAARARRHSIRPIVVMGSGRAQARARNDRPRGHAPLPTVAVTSPDIGTARRIAPPSDRPYDRSDKTDQRKRQNCFKNHLGRLQWKHSCKQSRWKPATSEHSNPKNNECAISDAKKDAKKNAKKSDAMKSGVKTTTSPSAAASFISLTFRPLGAAAFRHP